MIVYPTDSSYALGCPLSDKAAAERIRQIRQTDRQHNFTLVYRDLSEITPGEPSRYRLSDRMTPGPFTFIRKRLTKCASSKIPPQDHRHRVPDNAIVSALLAALNEPIMSCTLMLPGDDAAPAVQTRSRSVWVTQSI